MRTSENITKVKEVDAKAPISHRHNASEIDGIEVPDIDLTAYATKQEMQNALNGKANSIHTHDEYAPKTHRHSASDIEGLDGDGNVDLSNYYTKSETDTRLGSKANSVHTHTEYAVTNHKHNTEYSALNHTHSFNSLEGIPTFPDTSLFATKSELSQGLSGKANTSHTHTIGEVTGMPDLSSYATKSEMNSALSGKANTSHSHSEYASTNHSHSGYASTSHTHSGYASSSHQHNMNDLTGQVLQSNYGYLYLRSLTNNFGGLIIDSGEGYARPESSGNLSLGSDGYRFHGAYFKNNPNVSSDRRVKENIEYVNTLSTTPLAEEQLHISDFYNFVKDNLKVAEYDYIVDEQRTEDAMYKHNIGFIAQDIENTKVGKKIITKDSQGMLAYQSGSYVSVLAGALQQAIMEIEELKKKINGVE